MPSHSSQLSEGCQNVLALEYRHGEKRQKDMDRIKKHLIPKRRITERLRRLGFTVRTISPIKGYDLLVNDRVRVALRVAFPRLRRHHVTVRDRRYTYRYRSWHFNFHHHGKLDKRYADVFVCLAMEPQHPSREEAFIIPWESVSGKTFSLHAARKRYAGQYAQYLNRWRLVASTVAETPLRHVA
jgi:hypothetical protein